MEMIATIEVNITDWHELNRELSALKYDRRERIAMAAMQGLLSDPECGLEPELLAKEAVHYADALIAKLEKEKKNG